MPAAWLEDAASVEEAAPVLVFETAAGGAGRTEADSCGAEPGKRRMVSYSLLGLIFKYNVLLSALYA